MSSQTAGRPGGSSTAEFAAGVVVGLREFLSGW